MFDTIKYINKAKDLITNFNKKETKEVNNTELDELEKHYEGNIFMEELIRQAKKENKITFFSIKDTFNILQDNIKEGTLSIKDLKDAIIDFFIQTKNLIINGSKVTISTIIYISLSIIAILAVLNPIIWVPVLIIVIPIFSGIDNLISGDNNSKNKEIQKIKIKIDNLQTEIILNQKYFDENKIFFNKDNYSEELLKQFTEKMIFKKIIYFSDIEDKMYEINTLISEEFIKLNESYSKETNINNKEEIIIGIEEINKIKEEQKELMKEIHLSLFNLIKETLRDILSTRYILKEKLNKNYNKVLQQNIEILDENIKVLEHKIKIYQ